MPANATDSPAPAAASPTDDLTRRALSALKRQIEVLERIAIDTTVDAPHRLRAVEMLARLAGRELGPRHDGPAHHRHDGKKGKKGKHDAADD